MKAFTSDDSKKLLELLEKQHDLVEEILKITKGQSELVQIRDVEQFGNTIDQVDEIIEQINGLHQEASPLMQSYNLYKTSSGGSAVPEIDKLTSSLQAKLSEGSEIHQYNIGLVTDTKGELTKEIAKLADEKKGVGGYKTEVPRESKLIDKTQ